MSPRRMILRELNQRHQNGAGGYTRPGAIAGFAERPGRFQEAVNQLLQERLINGTKDEEGRLAIALNEHRIADVRKELRPWFTRPGTLVAAFAAIAIIVVGILALQPTAPTP